MNLLNKSIRSYLIYAAIVLIIAIPVFYFVIQAIVKEDVDESLMAHKELILEKLEEVIDNNPFPFLSAFEPNLSISPGSTSNLYDKFYSISIFDTISNENIPYRILESNVFIKKKPYLIKFKSSLIDSKDLIQSVFLVMTALLLAIVIGLIIINKALAKKIWAPFYNTLAKLHRFKIEDKEPIQFGKTSINEFTELNNTISSLAKRNQQVYQSQKEFTENASHEMQTPLAIFQHKLELLMQTNPLSTEQAELISELADANQRINKLNKNLLLIAKIENNQFLEKEELSIKELLLKLIEQFKFRTEEKSITVQLQVENDITIEANKSLLEILFSNLLSNAIRHNYVNGKIEISINKNHLSIANTGKEECLDKNKLFQRFQKQTGENSGTGLGLEIAKKIGELYEFKIEYQFVNNLHQFNIYFQGN
ncbi:MAG: HAMP domain-containing sensor histidine kinase [Chitinophagaceae bacterium]